MLRLDRAREGALVCAPMSWKALILALVSVALLGSDCRKRSLTDRLDGREFLLDTAEGYEPVERTRIEVDFDGKQLSAYAGCNRIEGPFRVRDERLVSDELSQTEVGCEPALHTQDDWLAAFLSSRPRISLDGHELTLRGDEATLHFRDREVADPDRPLQGTLWSIDSYSEGETLLSFGSRHPALTFRDDGKVHVFYPDTECKLAHGSYTVQGERITFSEMSYQDCGTPTVEEYVQFVIANGVTRFDIGAQQLVLLRDGFGLGASTEE
jgi:heat shock protein HslJ